MASVRVKFKKLDDRAVIPTKGTIGSAGYDLTIIDVELDSGGNYIGRTGIAIEIPTADYVLQTYIRSSLAKKGLMLANSVGIIDSDYRGEIMAMFISPRSILWHKIHVIGEKVIQGILIRKENITWVEVDELEDSGRGTGGFGSTDRVVGYGVAR